jgi:hypothetical protein
VWYQVLKTLMTEIEPHLSLNDAKAALVGLDEQQLQVLGMCYKYGIRKEHLHDPTVRLDVPENHRLLIECLQSKFSVQDAIREVRDANRFHIPLLDELGEFLETGRCVVS